MKKEYRFKTLSVRAHIHADGDVYVSNGKGHFYLVGALTSDKIFGEVPDRHYLRAKKWVKIGKKTV